MTPSPAESTSSSTLQPLASWLSNSIHQAEAWRQSWTRPSVPSAEDMQATWERIKSQDWSEVVGHRFGQIRDVLAERLQAPWAESWLPGLGAHGLLVWGVQHPVWGGAIAIVGLILLVNLLKLLFNPRAWFKLLGFPFVLVARWVTPRHKLAGLTHQAKVDSVLKRMQQLQKEQQQLQQQLETLLKSKSR